MIDDKSIIVPSPQGIHGVPAFQKVFRTHTKAYKAYYDIFTVADISIISGYGNAIPGRRLPGNGNIGFAFERQCGFQMNGSPHIKHNNTPRRRRSVDSFPKRPFPAVI